MLKEKHKIKEPDMMGSGNGLETDIDAYEKRAIKDIRFTLIIKPAIISFIALIISFFLDLSTVPILGNVTTDIAESLFPGWHPSAEMIAPYSFWWLPVFVYALFIFLAYLAYSNLKLEVMRTPASETIDRVITSYTSIIDSISTALPLIGAAILLVSIRLGEEVFLGISVPFEIKALIILALGKLFEPVLDELGVEFQNIVNHVKDIREKYYSRLQVENSAKILARLTSIQAGLSVPNVSETSVKELEQYKNILGQASNYSESIMKNYAAVHELMGKMEKMNGFSPEKVEQLKSLANSISQATSSLSDEKTITGLKYLESIVKK